MIASDRNLLKEAASRLADALREETRGQLQVKKNFAVDKETNGNGGWSVNIATWAGRPTVALSLDKYLGGAARHFWYGFWSFEKAAITDLIKQLPVDLHPKAEFRSVHSKERNGIWVLKRVPHPSVLSSPIAEFYEDEGDDEENDFGMYDTGRSLDVGRAVSFIVGVVDAIDNDEGSLSLQIRQLLNDGSISETTRSQLIQARLGQGKFRESLLSYWGHACSVTQCDVTQVLRASHIKPWKDSSNDERLDPDNGLLLSANLDALFDKHLISFGEDGRMLVSEYLTDEHAKSLGLSGKLSRDLNDRQKIYLEIHRSKHLEKSRGNQIR